MSTWPELVSVALLGTERREPPALGEPELAELVADGTAEERLLSAAGALALYRRAGRGAVPAPELPEPAPEETLAVYTPVRGTPLEADELRAVAPDWMRGASFLAEWLRALADRGLRASAEVLPTLLDQGTARPPLREEVEAVLGERGRWLAAQAPRWSWAAPLPVGDAERDVLWATGEREERQRLFALIRREQPARARDLLADGWASEGWEDRMWFVSALADGLSLDDEPFLEHALDDSNMNVRVAAARQLSRLAASALARRMTARALPLVRVEGKARKRLNVSLPEEFEEGMARDGIRKKPPRGMGERAAWLQGIVELTPLGTWAEIGLSPDDAARLRVNDDLELTLRWGFANAAQTQRDPEWARAFLHMEARLVELVDVESATPAILEHLRKDWTEMAELVPPPWPRALSEPALDLLVKLVDRGGFRLGPRTIALGLDPELTDEAEKRLGGLEPGSTKARNAEEILATLSLRRQMYEELR